MVRAACPHCAKTYFDASGVRTHVRSAHKRVRYPCTKCAKSYTTRAKMLAHVARKHDRTIFLCHHPICHALSFVR